MDGNSSMDDMEDLRDQPGRDDFLRGGLVGTSTFVRGAKGSQSLRDPRVSYYY